MPTTALIAGGIGAAGSIGAAAIGANASSTASKQQAAAQQQALQQQQMLFNLGLSKQAGYFDTAKTAFGTATNALAPYATAGTSVLPTLQGLLTPGTSASTLSQMPGFGFASQYGTMAATNALAAKTGPSAGPLAAAVSQFNNGLASTTWQNTVNALQNYANTGANAAGGIATSANNFADIAGSAGNAVLGASGVQAGLQGGTIGNIGNAQASGTLGSANALAGGVTGATGSGSNALLYNQLFGNGGSGGLYTPAQIGKIGNMDASSVSDAQSEAYGKAMGFT